MDVTMRQLKAFLEVARLLNFRAASTNLGVSQPSLSKMLQNLEYTLGAPLFHRTTRRVTLTDEGMRMIPIAEGLVHNFDSVIANARRNIRDRGTRVSIAISVTSVIPLIFPHVLRELSAIHPHIRVRLVSGLSRDMVKLVSLGDADFGIVGVVPDSDRFVARKLFSDRLVVIGRIDDPVMKDNTPMDWDCLNKLRFVAWTSGGGMREAIDTVPELAAIMARSFYEASNWSSLKGFLLEGLGLAIVPWVIAHQERNRELAFREIAQTVTGREVFIIERKNSTRSDVIEVVLEHVLRQAHERIGELPEQQ